MARELLGQSMTAVGYVVNIGRTKLLMRYSQKFEQWMPAGIVQGAADTTLGIVRQSILEDTGVTVRHLAEYGSSEEAQKTFVLEANEDEASKYELEELYDAQWLTKDQVLACTCIHLPAKEFANAILI